MRSLVLIALSTLLASCMAPVGAGPWTDATGAVVDPEQLSSAQGATEHCDWGSATFLFVGRGGGLPGVNDAWNDQFVRDPETLFDGSLAAAYEADVLPPSDAAFTGYRTSTVELWIAESDQRAVDIRVEGRFERWPRVAADHPLLCL